jgi:hypothetical protein
VDNLAQDPTCRSAVSDVPLATTSQAKAESEMRCGLRRVDFGDNETGCGEKILEASIKWPQPNPRCCGLKNLAPAVDRGAPDLPRKACEEERLGPAARWRLAVAGSIQVLLRRQP